MPTLAPASAPGSTSAAFDVFVSHATADDAVVSRIHQSLTRAGINAWVDHEHGITYGDDWASDIHQAANACKYGLFILSPASAKSTYCEAEWNRILALGKKLYIAMIETVPTADIPLRLGTIHYADLTPDFDSALSALIAAMQNQRNLDPAAVFTRRALNLTGPFPHWQRDLPLLGRDAELAAIRNLLGANHRAVVVLGLGGVGKTRLAAETATTPDPAKFPDGVIWHEIADYTSLAALTGLIRDHFRLTEKATDDQVWQTLDHKAALLVLDNAEACKEPAAYAARLNRLDLSGGTRILMTCRFDADWRDLRHPQRYSLHHPEPEAAARIFEAMIAAEPPTFPPGDQTPALVKAARYHPRLMQYTVRWLNDYPPQAVLTTLTTLKGTNAEEALEDMVLKTVAQVRARPGGEAAITALRRLAVCRGGFTYDAAQTLVSAEDGLRALATLKQWGLISVESSRYDLDPLVAAAVGEDDTAFVTHYDYFLALAGQHHTAQDYLGLDPDAANLEIAFERALKRDPEAAYWLTNACHEFLLNRVRARQFMAWLKQVEAALAETTEGGLHAVLNNSLGNAFCHLADVEERGDNLRRAVAAFSEALRYYTPGVAPLAYAGIKNNLGNAYRTLADVEERADNLRRAIAAYTQALQYYTPGVAPLDYAMTQNNLGTAYHQLADVEERADNLHRAIAAYTQALQYYIPGVAPLDYAMTKNNLGTAYRNLADVEERADNLRRAIAAFSKALQYYTPGVAPFDYAMTKNNLGIAYRNLADVEERADNLRRAIAAYTQALRFRTPGVAPLAYARTQANLGVTLEDSGDLAAAVVCWREAEPYFRQMDQIETADQVLAWIADGERRLAEKSSGTAAPDA